MDKLGQQYTVVPSSERRVPRGQALRPPDLSQYDRELGVTKEQLTPEQLVSQREIAKGFCDEPEWRQICLRGFLAEDDVVDQTDLLIHVSNRPDRSNNIFGYQPREWDSARGEYMWLPVQEFEFRDTRSGKADEDCYTRTARIYLWDGRVIELLIDDIYSETDLAVQSVRLVTSPEMPLTPVDVPKDELAVPPLLTVPQRQERDRARQMWRQRQRQRRAATMGQRSVGDAQRYP